MLKRIKFDSGDLIWFDMNDTTYEELDNSGLSYFDVTNIPDNLYADTFKNYYCTLFRCSKSSTGYCAMLVNKNRDIYFKRIDY